MASRGLIVLDKFQGGSLQIRLVQGADLVLEVTAYVPFIGGYVYLLALFPYLLLKRITSSVWSYVGARGPPMPCHREQTQTVCCRILGVRARNIRVVVKLVGGITWNVPALMLHGPIRCTEVV